MVDIPSHISPSSADSFDGCRRRWRFKYVDGIPDPPNRAALVGTFAHSVLERVCQKPSEGRTLDAAKELARTLWPEFSESEDFVGLGLDEEAERSFRWQTWLAIAGLWQVEDPRTLDVISTEQKVKVLLDDVPFTGVIDRVHRIPDGLVVTDYKSGLVPSTKWRGDRIKQVMLYAAALFYSDGEMPRQVRLLYLGQRVLNIDVFPKRIDNAVEVLDQTWRDMQTACETDDFPATPGPLCGWCPYVTLCPEGSGEIKRRFDEGTLHQHAPARALLAL